MQRRYLKLIVLYALLFFVLLQCFDGLIFLLSHLPPQAVHLDGLLRVLGAVERFFILPRRMLRRLWPWETTPTILNYALAVINWLVWGAIAATGKILRNRQSS